MPITGPEDGGSGPGGCFAAGQGYHGQVIEAEVLRLRPLTGEDRAALVELAGDPEVSRRTAEIPHPYTESDADDFVAGAVAILAGGTGVVLGMERRTEPGLVGCIGVHFGEGGVAEIGYWVGRPFWGRGFATEAVRAIARIAFANLGAQRLWAALMPENPASARVLEKAGFTETGPARHDKGRCAGLELRGFALDRADWEAREKAKPMLLVAAVALVDGDGRVLLARRPEGKSMAGLWEFPGGKVNRDEGETPEAALVRELAEELDVDITESCLAPFAFASHAYEDFQLLMPLYVCRVWKGEVRALEGQELRWVRPVRIMDFPMPPADIPLVPLLRDFLG